MPPPTLDERLANPTVDPTTAMMIRAMAQAGSPGIAAVDRATLQEVFGDVPLSQTPPTLRERLSAVASFAGNAILGRGGFGAAPFSKVMEGGKPKRVYRGTSAVYDVENPEKWNPSSLFGPGGYFTENPAVASTYAESRRYGNVESALAEAHNDLKGWTQQLKWVQQGQAKGADPTASASALRWAEREVQAAQKRITELEAVAPNVRASYLDITNPLDMEGPVSSDSVASILKAAREARIQFLPRPAKPGAPLTGDDVYKALTRSADAAIANDVLRRAGYDGITHIGGGRAGRGKEMHRVWITLDPKQEYPGFTPLPELP